MEKFEVVFTETAAKDLEKLDPQTRFRILGTAKVLEVSPFPRGTFIKRLRGSRTPLYRLRVGDFRIIYRIVARKVIVLMVVDRKDLEKELKKIL